MSIFIKTNWSINMNTILIVSVLAVVVLNTFLHRSKFIENKLLSSVIIFVALIFAGGTLFYGINTGSTACILVSCLLVYGAVDKYKKRILRAKHL